MNKKKLGVLVATALITASLSIPVHAADGDIYNISTTPPTDLGSTAGIILNNRAILFNMITSMGNYGYEVSGNIYRVSDVSNDFNNNQSFTPAQLQTDIKAKYTPVEAVPSTTTTVTISTINNITASANQGDSYSLPSTVTATMTDGSTQQLPVTWNNQANTSQAGTFSFYGTVSGYSGNVVFTLTVDELGNTGGNISNAGLAVESDGCVYYSNASDNFALYKMNDDGTGKVKLSDAENVEFINVYDGWVYYYENANNSSNSQLFKVRIDGTDNTQINIAGTYAPAWTLIVNRTIYGNDSYDSRLISVDMNNKSTILASNNSWYVNVSNGWIYYSNHSDNDKLYKISTTGNNGAKLSDDAVSYINVVGGWIYYINEADNRVYKMLTDGSNKTCIVEDSVANGLNVSNGYVYYVNDSNQYIYRVSPDGTGTQQINNVHSKNINIAGSKIYFTNPDDNTFHSMNLDGSLPETVN